MDFSLSDSAKFLYDVAFSIADAHNKNAGAHEFKTKDGETLIIRISRAGGSGLLFDLRISYKQDSWAYFYVADPHHVNPPTRQSDGHLSDECIDGLYDLYLEYAGVPVDHVELVDSNLRSARVGMTAAQSLLQTKKEIVTHRLRRLTPPSRP